MQEIQTMYNVSQEDRETLVSCLLRTGVGHLPGAGTMAPDILLIWSNVSPRQILWTLLLWYTRWSEEMLLWAQFHSEKNPHLLVPGMVGNDRTSKLRREK